MWAQEANFVVPSVRDYLPTMMIVNESGSQVRWGRGAGLPSVAAGGVDGRPGSAVIRNS